MIKRVKKVKVWGLLVSAGDGSAYVQWYLTEKDTKKADEKEDKDCGPVFSEICNEMAETYEGSNIHREAVENSKDLREGQ